MIQVDISAAVRSGTGKGVARSLRRAGKTPGVVYGSGGEATPLEFDTKDLTKALFYVHRRNAVVNLDIENNGKTERRHALIREVQVHPVKDTLVHADFCVIDLERERVFDVPVRFTGKAKGVDLGGDMIVACDSVPLKGKPLDIPDEVVVDVSGLGIGDAVTLGEIALPDGVTLVADGGKVCVSVAGAGGGVSAAAEEEEDAAA